MARRLVGRCIAVVSTFALSGCLYIPTPESGLLAGRGEILEADTAFLDHSESTVEEVLLAFGEPDLVLDGERVFVYHWTVSVGVVVVIAAGGFTGFVWTVPIPKNRALLLEFTESGMLRRHDLVSTGFRDRGFIDDWACGDR